MNFEYLFRHAGENRYPVNTMDSGSRFACPE